jgi:receptor protein-tyrosine kinase
MNDYFDQFLKIAIDFHHAAERENSSPVIAFTSSRPGEGTTTITCNMALAIASNLQKNTLLVDAGSRDGGPAKFMGVSGNPSGFFDIIEGKVEANQAIARHPDSGLYFLPAGNIPRYPIASLEKESCKNLINDLRKEFDFVIFDTMPVVVSPVTPLLASYLDYTILVVEAEKTRWEVAKHAKNTLHEAGAHLAGAILNKKQMFIPGFIYKYIL